MITTQRYFIHIDNKSVVPWTSEIEDNYKFKEISPKIALAVERGKISAQEVIDQITRQIKPATLEQMLEAKLKMNVREGNLNLEAQVKEDNTQKDTDDAAPYEVNLPGEGESGDDTPPPQEPENAEEAPADDADADKVAGVLDGGVNV